jgi:hypothetical protein
MKAGFHLTSLCRNEILVYFVSAILFALSTVGQTQGVHLGTGEIHGTVYQQKSLKHLARVSVRLVEIDRQTLTDENGVFRFSNLPARRYTLTTSAPGYRLPENRVVRVEAGKITTVQLHLEPLEFQFDEVVVTSSPFQVQVGQQSISALEMKRIPGTAGDALRALHSLPGIGVANDLDGRLYIRGGGPNDNLFYFDRTPLGYPYHFGALVATVSSEVIDQIDVYAGGFGAEFGANAQAVIDIRSRNGGITGFGGRANLNPLYSEGLLEGTLGERGAWYLAGRRSYVDLLPIEVDQITAFPRFWDYQGKLSLSFGERHQLHLSAFAADDFLTLKLGLDDVNNDPTLAGSARFKNSFNSQGVHLRSILSNRLISNLSLSRGYDLFDIKFGVGYFLRFEPTQYSLREDLIYRLNAQHQLETGLLFSTGQWSAKSFFTRPPDEGEADYIFTFEEKVDVDVSKRSDFVEGYLQSRYTPFAFLSIALGARVDYFNLTDRVSLGPRGSLKLKIPSGSEIRFAYGRYAQSPQPYQILPQIGNPTVKENHAIHYILEVERDISAQTGITVAGYRKELSNLISRDENAAYLNQGEGFAQGVEVLLRHRGGEKFFGWASYAYSVSKRRDRPGEPERFYSFDQTHVTTLIASYKPTPTWEIGAKWQYSTGNPYTPVVDVEVKPHPVTGRSLYSPIYGETNSARLSAFHRLDFRVKKTFVFEGWQMGAFLEILNLYNRKNILTFDYKGDYSEKETVHQLPLIPYFGVTVAF